MKFTVEAPIFVDSRAIDHELFSGILFLSDIPIYVDIGTSFSAIRTSSFPLHFLVLQITSCLGVFSSAAEVKTTFFLDYRVK